MIRRVENGRISTKVKFSPDFDRTSYYTSAEVKKNVNDVSEVDHSLLFILALYFRNFSFHNILGQKETTRSASDCLLPGEVVLRIVMCCVCGERACLFVYLRTSCSCVH